MPTHLSDAELDAIMRAAKPLAPDRRQPFIDEVITALQSMPVRGPGNLHRVIADVQRQHFDAPKFATTLSAPRAGRVR